MKKKISLKDIAQKVGVSTALVSYVLNNQKEGRISKEIAEKIRAAARRMNYRTNQIARSLRTSKTYTIGLIIGDIANPFFSALARIIGDEADKNNYTVLFGSSDEDAEKFSRLVDTLLNRQVDGLILSPPENTEAQILLLQKQKIPFVLIDRYFPSIKANSVVIDNFGAAYNAVEHLVNGNRRRIGMISYKTGLFHLQERTLGYLAALKERGIRFKKGWLKELDIRADSSGIQKSVHELLNLREPADAILFATNSIAGSAVKYINTLPVKVPEALALVCFDEAEALDLFYAPLTYIQQPLSAIGQAAIEVLLENINSKHQLSRIKMKGQLVIRKSSMPA